MPAYGMVQPGKAVGVLPSQIRSRKTVKVQASGEGKAPQVPPGESEKKGLKG